VLKLPPAHTLTIRHGEPLTDAVEYWDVPFDTSAEIDAKSAERELIDRLKEAVEIRLVSEVPLGAFLSGGVDSSAVVAMMAGLSEEPVNTCSISFGDREFNEEPYANLIAQKYRTNHQVQQVDPDDFDLVGKLADLYDEPYADSSAIPTYRVCELARKRVTVALSGDGGDENLAGYRRYLWHLGDERLRSLMPYGLRRPIFGLLGRAYPKLDWAPRILRGKSTFQFLARDSVEGYLHRIAVVSDPMRKQLYSQTFKTELQGYQAVEVLRRHARKAPQHPLSLIQYLDMKTYLPGDILTKVDRASMAHALEVRVPLLDHKLVEWISGLPPEVKLQGRQGKYLFKKALEPHLPDAILYRPKKGFAVPLASWFRGPLRQRVRDAVLGPVMMDSGIFNRQFLSEMLDQHHSGKKDHSAKIWALLMYEAFARRVLV
jgi:asparagine synthase (glutamine-hydrolysing)